MSERFMSNLPNVLSSIDNIKYIQIGIVEDNVDPEGLGRIKVRIEGSAEVGGDFGLTTDELAWSYPMVSKFFTAIPRVGEGVFVFILKKDKTHSDRLYFGPIISQLSNLDFNKISTVGTTPFTFTTTKAKINVDRIPELNGVFHKPDDVVLQGRYNTDIILRKNEIQIRAGKFVEITPNENNPYDFTFNTTTPAYIQLKNGVKINSSNEIGSAANIVANKINLLTHKDGSPSFNLANQDNQLSDEELLKILDSAHPLPFGDILIQYLRMFKNAFFNHVHSSNGTPPTDLKIGLKNVGSFKTESADLENRMLSHNIKIN